MQKTGSWLTIVTVLLLFACAPKKEKEIVVSIPADGRWDRYPTPEAVCGLLDTIAWAGFNSIKVDVKPVVGYCEFESSYLEPMRTMKTRPHAHEDWDYARVFIDEGHRRGLKVSLTCAVFPLGAWQLSDGPAFRDSTKNDWFCTEYLPDGLHDIRQSRRQGVFCFMNPSHPEVHDFVLGYITELLEKYKPDGFQLDYCRYNNINCDFSPYSREAFEKWLGREVERFPQDIYTFASDDPSDIVPGPLFKAWIKWRASVIQGYVREVRDIVKRVSPRTALRYWGAAWWHGLYLTGQNWCSPSTAEPMDYPWADEDYASTGIADLVDYFELGTYRPRVYGPEDPESMEYDLARARSLAGPDNIIYGSFSSGCDIYEAFRFLYANADGVSFFPVDALRKDPSLWEVFRKAITDSKEP